MDKFFNIQRFANISNSNSNTLISGTSGADSIYIPDMFDVYLVTIDSGNGDDTVTGYFYHESNIYGGEWQ